MPKGQLSKTLTAMAGEFYVAAELCRRGYVAGLTMKNFPKVDIFALNPATGRQVAIQVKTTGANKNPSFFVPQDPGGPEMVFVFVTLSAAGYEAYVLRANEVRALSRQARTDYLQKPHKKPLREEDQPLMLGLSEIAAFQGRWDRVFDEPTGPGGHAA